MVASEREYMHVKVNLPFTRAEFRAWLAEQTTTGPQMYDVWSCYLCGRPVFQESISIDHVTPFAQGGRSTLGNLSVCCVNCNRAKGALSLGAYRSLKSAVGILSAQEQRYFWTRWSAGSRTRWTEGKRADDRKAREILKNARGK
jgi:hypothetical protein